MLIVALRIVAVMTKIVSVVEADIITHVVAAPVVTSIIRAMRITGTGHVATPRKYSTHADPFCESATEAREKVLNRLSKRIDDRSSCEIGLVEHDNTIWIVRSCVPL